MISSRKITGVMACDEAGMVGNSQSANGLPNWDCPQDMKNFLEVTKGHCMVMGWNTYQFLAPSVLKYRTSIVLVKEENKPENTGNVAFVTNFIALANQIQTIPQEQEIFMIGGVHTASQLFQQNLIDSFLLTRISGTYEGDCAFTKEFLQKLEEQKGEIRFFGKNFITTAYTISDTHNLEGKPAAPTELRVPEVAP